MLDRMLSKGLIEEDEASELLGPLRQQRDKQQVLLESIEEPTNVIEIQPKAVRRFRENIENLSAILAQGEEEPPPELLGPFRQLVAAVVVYPTENGQVYEIGIKGYLSSLIDTDLSVMPDLRDR
ncbi:hypothetical protein [Rhizobium leguminosarum]|uniref:hypothetical protein n=1 Tax=Rhizobium leguminosarum TaxID=384 RepID=UPI001C97930A|nr:hypothetical protein [Rhizobium leguminosarum]MBY5666639.1 hypothetical protein [Rhizobium leguminosarum]MBY5680090.1 hypothetical protein [Rhizobium leguminosarum]